MTHWTDEMMDDLDDWEYLNFSQQIQYYQDMEAFRGLSSSQINLAHQKLSQIYQEDGTLRSPEVFENEVDPRYELSVEERERRSRSALIAYISRLTLDALKSERQGQEAKPDEEEIPRQQFWLAIPKLKKSSVKHLVREEDIQVGPSKSVCGISVLAVEKVDRSQLPEELCKNCSRTIYPRPRPRREAQPREVVVTKGAVPELLAKPNKLGKYVLTELGSQEIRELRLRQHLTQNELVDRTYAASSALTGEPASSWTGPKVSGFERGNIGVTEDELRIYLHGLGTSLEEINENIELDDEEDHPLGWYMMDDRDDEDDDGEEIFSFPSDFAVELFLHNKQWRAHINDRKGLLLGSGSGTTESLAIIAAFRDFLSEYSYIEDDEM